MHNKLFIADGAIAVAGGRNIADEYFMRSHRPTISSTWTPLIVGAVVAAARRDLRQLLEQPPGVPDRVDSRLGQLARGATREFDSLVDEGDQMMSAAPPPIDVLGYGPIARGPRRRPARPRLGHGDGVRRPARQGDRNVRRDGALDERAEERDGSRDGVQADVVITSPYFIPGPTGVRAFSDLRSAR